MLTKNTLFVATDSSSPWLGGCFRCGNGRRRLSLTEERSCAALRTGRRCHGMPLPVICRNRSSATVALSTVVTTLYRRHTARAWDAIMVRTGRQAYGKRRRKPSRVFSLATGSTSDCFAPAAVPVSGVRAFFVLTGQTDLFYAAELRGNKWEGERFAGNRLKADRPGWSSTICSHSSASKPARA